MEHGANGRVRSRVHGARGTADRRAPTPAPDDGSPEARTTAELARDLSRGLTELVHEELALAKAELRQKGKEAGRGAGLLGVAAAVGLVGLGVLTACVVAAIALVLPVWLAALVVGVSVEVVAGVLAVAARGGIRRAVPPVPEQAMRSMKEDVTWLETRARSARNRTPEPSSSR